MRSSKVVKKGAFIMVLCFYFFVRCCGLYDCLSEFFPRCSLWSKDTDQGKGPGSVKDAEGGGDDGDADGGEGLQVGRKRLTRAEAEAAAVRVRAEAALALLPPGAQTAGSPSA